jgi:uncharacterized small protein (DUF1192 family)
MVTEDPGSNLKNTVLLDLEDMSIEALNDYIFQLNIEIKRVRSEISLKQKAKLGAESVFK